MDFHEFSGLSIEFPEKLAFPRTAENSCFSSDNSCFYCSLRRPPRPPLTGTSLPQAFLPIPDRTQKFPIYTQTPTGNVQTMPTTPPPEPPADREISTRFCHVFFDVLGASHVVHRRCGRGTRMPRQPCARGRFRQTSPPPPAPPARAVALTEHVAAEVEE